MTAGVYIHIPFCISRCSYCDFATEVLREDVTVSRYVDALICEIDRFSTDEKIAVDTVYFGGGTPSLLSGSQLSQIFAAVCRKFDLAEDIEFTVEMNPATVTPEKLAEFRSIGVNRASFGVQTFNEKALKLLARGHNAEDARDTYKMLRNAGFTNISFDLIGGLPGQTLDDWNENLKEAVALSPDHISLYLLEIHENTPLAEQIRSKRRPMPDDDVASEMYEVMIETLENNGFKQYEISNFAKPGRESRHNIKYWNCEPVYGFGVSAHSFDGKVRYANIKRKDSYVSTLNDGKTVVTETNSLSDIQLSSEFVFLRLRLSEGLNLTEFRSRFGFDLVSKYENEISDAKRNGLLAVDADRLCLTRRGQLFSNEVFAIFV